MVTKSVYTSSKISELFVAYIYNICTHWRINQYRRDQNVNDAVLLYLRKSSDDTVHSRTRPCTTQL